jgi:uncharacterized protein (TIGR02246 family)
MRALKIMLCCALLALPASASAQESMDADTAIRAGSQAWAAAWNAGDAKALAALYTEDAIVMAPGGEPAQGRTAIMEAFQAAIEEAAGAQNKTMTKEVMAMGDWAIELGGFVTDAASGSHLDHGPFIAVWKKVDGKWLIHRDIWNSSM